MNFSYHIVILSIAKDLNASTNAFQILHCVQNDILTGNNHSDTPTFISLNFLTYTDNTTNKYHRTHGA